MMKGAKMCGLHKVSWVLVLIGALNWGLVGIANVNVVDLIFGAWPIVVRIIYVLVGLAALVMLGAGKCCLKCEKCGSGMEEKKPMAPPQMPQGQGGEHKM